MSSTSLILLGDLLENISAGVSLPGENRVPRDGEVGILTLSAVVDTHLNTAACKAVPAALIPKLGPSVRAGTIVMSRSNTPDLVGSCVYVEKDCVDRYLPDLLWQITVRPDAPCSGKWVVAYLRTVEGRRTLLRAAAGTSGTMIKLSMDRLRSLKIPVPPPAVQDDVVSTIDRLDRMARCLGSLVTAKRTFRGGLTQQLLTGRTRFPEFRRRPWDHESLGNLVEPVTRRNTGGVTRVLSASGEHGLVDQRRYFNKSVAGEDISRYYLLKRGEFAYNRSAMRGYPFGASKRLDEYEEGALSTLYSCFAIKDARLDTDYLVHLFESGVLNRQLRRIVRVGGRAHGLLNITASEYFAIGIPLPEPDEQRRIAGLLNACSHEIALLERLRQQTVLAKNDVLASLLRGACSVET